MAGSTVKSRGAVTAPLQVKSKTLVTGYLHCDRLKCSYTIELSKKLESLFSGNDD